MKCTTMLKKGLHPLRLSSGSKAMRNKMPRADRAMLMTIPTFSRALGVDVRVVRKAIEDGKLRTVCLSKNYLIPRTELERIATI